MSDETPRPDLSFWREHYRNDPMGIALVELLDTELTNNAKLVEALAVMTEVLKRELELKKLMTAQGRCPTCGSLEQVKPQGNLN